MSTARAGNTDRGLAGRTNAHGTGRGGVGLAADSAFGALLATRHVARHRLRCSMSSCHTGLLMGNNNINAVAGRECWHSNVGCRHRGLAGRTNAHGTGRGGVGLAADSAVGALLTTINVAGPGRRRRVGRCSAKTCQENKRWKYLSR